MSSSITGRGRFPGAKKDGHVHILCLHTGKWRGEDINMYSLSQAAMSFKKVVCCISPTRNTVSPVASKTVFRLKYCNGRRGVGIRDLYKHLPFPRRQMKGLAFKDCQMEHNGLLGVIPLLHYIQSMRKLRLEDE